MAHFCHLFLAVVIDNIKCVCDRAKVQMMQMSFVALKGPLLHVRTVHFILRVPCSHKKSKSL